MISARQAYAMLGNESLWQVAQSCHAMLEQARIPYAIVGGVAVCLHGYQRNTVDLDLLIRREDQALVKTVFEQAGLKWSSSRQEFRSESGIPVQILLSGDKSGRDAETRLPDPAAPEICTQLEGLSVLSLAALIEAKLACGAGDPRRTHKDFADVVELIAQRRLTGAFARHLHKSLQPAFRELVKHARS
jgi:hypothetical protein